MTMPAQHNCEHSPEGWCLACVNKLIAEKDAIDEPFRDLLASARLMASALHEIGVTTSGLNRFARQALVDGIAAIERAAKVPPVYGDPRPWPTLRDLVEAS